MVLSELTACHGTPLQQLGCCEVYEGLTATATGSRGIPKASGPAIAWSAKRHRPPLLRVCARSTPCIAPSALQPIFHPRGATGNRGNVWQLATVAACGNWQPWQRVATGTRGKRSNMWQLATVATCGNWQPWQRVATGNRGNVWQLATVATCGNVWQLATVATCGNRQPWQRVAQVLDVQQARGTLEDLSTTTYMTVLTQFERFQIATRPPVCPPPSEPVHLPAASSAERTASGLARAASLAVATPGDASRPVVQDLHHFLPFMRIVSVRFYMTVTQLAALMMDLPDSPDPSQPNLPRCGRVICSSFSTQYM